MDRRTFLGTAAVAGLALGASGSAKAAEGSAKTADAPSENFVIVGASNAVETLYKDGGKKYGPVQIRRYIVECPFEVGSRRWLPVSDHIDGQVVVATESDAVSIVKPRRVVFPRLVEGPGGIIEGTNDHLDDRVFDTYEAVRTHGFDSVKPDDCFWKIVWVEFQCIDGRREHIIAGLPEHWSSTLPLNVMVTQTIT